MVQFNLLPDVKQEYMKARRQKHSVIVISLLVAAASLFIFVMLFLTVNVFQKGHLGRLDDSIAENTQILKDTKDLDKILTIQNQLQSLPSLHDQKPVTSRLFGYLTQVTPAQVNIGSVTMDYTAKSIEISGTSDSLSTINKFVDTLKFTTYTSTQSGQPADSSATPGQPFNGVVLTSFARSDKQSTYQISFKFDSAIFESQKDIKLVVPKIISTRSETEKPTELFKALPAEKENQ